MLWGDAEKVMRAVEGHWPSRKVSILSERDAYAEPKREFVVSFEIPKLDQTDLSRLEKVAAECTGESFDEEAERKRIGKRDRGGGKPTEEWLAELVEEARASSQRSGRITIKASEEPDSVQLVVTLS